MRQDLFLPQELSNLLISKGFNEEVVGIYGGERGIMLSGATVGFNFNHFYYEKHGAILWVQAEGFLREVKGLSVEIISYLSEETDKLYYKMAVKKNAAPVFYSDAKLSSYNFAKRSGIEWAIKSLE